MSQLKKFHISFTLGFVCIILFLTAVLPAAQEEPVWVIFNNGSAHTVRINIISTGMIAGTHTLGARQNLEVMVPFGHEVHLEYQPCPKRTKLSVMGSKNELNRTVLLKDDGENLFIQEKFSGARKQTRKRGGKRSIPGSVISSPDEVCLDKSAGKKEPGPLKEMGGIPKVTRKEDPMKPAPKKKINSDKKAKDNKKKVKKKGKEKQ